MQSPPISIDYRNIFNDKPDEPQSSTAHLSPVVQMDTNTPSSTNQHKCSYHRQCTRTADVHHHPVQPLQVQVQPCEIALAARQAIQQEVQRLDRQTQQEDEEIQQQYQQQQLQHQQQHQQQLRQQQLLQSTAQPSTASTYARRLVRQHQQLLQQSRLNSTDNTSASVAANHITRDAISTNVLPQLNAALLQERYLLLELVDGSSFYKCVDITTQKMLVCKVVNNPCTNLLTAHFRLDGHQNVNFLEKVIQSTNQSYLFFEPSQGDLHSHVRVRKRLRENEARNLFRQMCEVVKSCHAEGIVLRDLKLRKFVFADVERTQIKLESLEDAVILENASEDLLQDKRGCPAYVSPEILRANASYSGKAADMWSLGVILYTMLMGRYPFNDSEHASLFAKISRGIYVLPDCLSSKSRCIIRALLRRDPDERITSDDVLFHPWLKTNNDNRDVFNSKTATANNDQCVPEWVSNEDTDGDSCMNAMHTNGSSSKR
ncbi:unnamed protein product [Diamesa serratosioi]